MNQDSALPPDITNQSHGSSLASTPIAPRLGLDYAFPPHLEYAYPPPDGNILTNIVNALIAVPRFYTQGRDSPVISRTKRRKISILGPACDKDADIGAAGVKPSSLVPKEIPFIRKKNTVLQINIPVKATMKGKKDDNTGENFEPEKENPILEPFATLEEIRSNKLAPEEILSLPQFKNYTVGNPSTVLYIKNLAKDVTLEDFFYIFGSLFGGADAAKAGLEVKLMQEGRMKGQAFVTFPSVELARHALQLVNGYVLKGKPIIIQFGRGPAAVAKRD